MKEEVPFCSKDIEEIHVVLRVSLLIELVTYLIEKHQYMSK